MKVFFSLNDSRVPWGESNHFSISSTNCLYVILCPGTLVDCYDELGNRYQLPYYVLSAPANLIDDASESDTGADADANATPGVEQPIRFRLSTLSHDIKLQVCTTDTVLKVKKRISEMQVGVEPHRQRWFYAGRMLNDKLHIEDCKIPKNHVVQVIVSVLQQDKGSWGLIWFACEQTR